MPERPGRTRPDISIIIPTYRRPGEVLDCLRSVARAVGKTPLGLEVVVVDDGGNLPREIEGQAPPQLNVHWIHLPQNLGQPRAQAAGIGWARGAVLAFLDDDVWVAPNWIQAICDYFERHPDVGATLGKIEAQDTSHILSRMRQQIYELRHRTYTNPQFAARLKAQYGLRLETEEIPRCARNDSIPRHSERSEESRNDSVARHSERSEESRNDITSEVYLSDHVSGGNFAIRQETLRSVGGIASEVRRGGDRLLAERLLQAGYAIGYNPEMVVYHQHHRGYQFLVQNSFRVGRSRTQGALASGSGRVAALGNALLALFLAPFQIRKAPELHAADPCFLKVYLNYTGIQFIEAVGQVYQAVLTLIS